MSALLPALYQYEIVKQEAMNMSEKLPTYEVIYENGTSYVTSMAAGVTLDEARAYFIGHSIEQPDEQTSLRIVAVRPAHSAILDIRSSWRYSGPDPYRCQNV